MASTPLAGFLPGTLKTSEHGNSPGYGQVVPMLQIPATEALSGDPIELDTNFKPIVDRTGKAATKVTALNVGDVGGAGAAVTLRLRRFDYTPTGNERNIVTALPVAAAALVDIFADLSSVVVPADYILEMSASAAGQLNATPVFLESRHQ